MKKIILVVISVMLIVMLTACSSAVDSIMEGAAQDYGYDSSATTAESYGETEEYAVEDVAVDEAYPEYSAEGASSYVIDSERPCIIIANKADKIAITKVDAQVRKLQDELNPLHDLVFLPFSAERKIYTEKAWDEIEEFL